MNGSALRYARAFVALGRERHFARAGAALGVSQSAISRQLTELETALGFALVQRTTRTVTLTPAGQRLWTGLVDGLGVIDASCTEAREYARGRMGVVRMGYTRSAMALLGGSTIQWFRHEFPDIVIEMHEMGTNAQVDALARDTIEVGLLHPPIPADGLDLRAIGDDEIGLAIALDHPLAAATRTTIAAICDVPAILYPRAAGPHLYDALIALYRSCGAGPSVVQECTSWETATELAASGLGVAWVPGAIARRHGERVAFLSVDGPVPRLPLVVATRKSARCQSARTVADRIGLAATPLG